MHYACTPTPWKLMQFKHIYVDREENFSSQLDVEEYGYLWIPSICLGMLWWLLSRISISKIPISGSLLSFWTVIFKLSLLTTVNCIVFCQQKICAHIVRINIPKAEDVCFLSSPMNCLCAFIQKPEVLFFFNWTVCECRALFLSLGNVKMCGLWLTEC